METSNKGAGTVVNPLIDLVILKNTWRKISLASIWDAKGVVCAKAPCQESHQSSEDREGGQAPTQG